MSTMTSRNKTSRTLRIFAGVAAVTLFLGALPLAAAGVNLGIVDVAMSGGCKSYVYSGGTGYIEGSPHHHATGWWTNGCGGNNCDDNVQGYTVINGNNYHFSVQEFNSSGQCLVFCEFGGATFASTGGVWPGHDKTYGYYVTFSCDNAFSGALWNAKPVKSTVDDVAALVPEIMVQASVIELA